MNPIIQYLQKFHPISEESHLEILSISKLRRIRAGECYVKAGEIPVHMFTLISGIVRAYVRNDKGKEFNRKIFTGPAVAGSLTALIKQEPSVYALEALTDCDIYCTDYQKFIELSNKNLEVKELYIKMLETFFMEYSQRQIELLTLTATERYLKLKAEISHIEDLIPQYQIAACLGITPVQLSRIRKKIRTLNIL
ncbi:Crp/Fnr family transcriptional regulator [Tamlana sp. 62-3]|uniref:Crp/Fnr family transcriptional regulator n=1 Tax=Neotamlana sargassicola TaxID=2883125 RepID=A0A9X1I683_9FLAO|nr:Crp/Fnr family transcriptional regulator [Tamlana sargassicola]MCB4808601.1 Crp/Fnr family transcriptional regulator [Tamlana sargassicola]